VSRLAMFLAGALALAAAGLGRDAHSEAQAPKRARTVLLKAGAIHTVDEAGVVLGGALLLRDGKVVAVGANLTPPPGAEVVDYGPDAVIVPGLVAARSNYGANFAASARSVDPFVRAADHFDPYSRGYVSDLMGGVTTVYVTPASNRLIAGQGAVVKLAGAGERLIDDSASIHGTITADARRVPGYWDPPIPATIENGLGVVEPQLPGSAFGAGMALDELLAIVRGRSRDDGAWGPGTADKLRELVDARLTWRLGADTVEEIRVLIEFARREKLPLVIEGGDESAELAAELAGAGVGVILTVDVAGQSSGRDLGKDKDTRWPRYDNAAKLAEAGVELAIAPGGNLRARDVRFAAQVASRGGLGADAALRAITLGAAQALGLEARIGSLAPGKDADVCVLSGAPMAATSGVVATWIEGELVWKAASASAVVIEAQEVHLGDGHVLRPGQILLRDGKIAEVGGRVARPVGARVIRGFAAMPGMIDAFGFLGLEGSQQAPATDFPLKRILDTPDHVDRHVARNGVTTVVLSPRGSRDTGAPMMAYKPASEKVERQVVADPTGLRLAWSDGNRLKSGEKVVALLKKAADYDKKWREYEEALKKWVPPPPEAEEAAGEGDASAEKKDEKKDDAKPEEKKDESADKKEGDKDKKDAKKKGKEEDEPDPVTGVWVGKLDDAPEGAKRELRLRLELQGESVSGALRCDELSAVLVSLVGAWTEKKVVASGWGSRGPVSLEGVAKAGKFEGSLAVGETKYKFTAERESKELPVAGRSEVRREKKDEVKEPKGKPRSPGLDGKLEPFRRAMRGEAAIVVAVDREDEILACVAAFEQVGIKPVLQGADDVWRIADKLRGRVAGVLLSHTLLMTEPEKGLDSLRNRYSDLAALGIPLGFHSLAEEGAAELPMFASYAVSLGFSPDAALRALTSDVARMMGIHSRVGLLAPGLDGDVLLLDGAPLEPATSVLKTFVDGEEVR
jgi:imidazolonepropionase-like amidohydrolase